MINATLPSSFSPGILLSTSFDPLQRYFDAQDYEGALNKLLFLFNTDADPETCYTYLFKLFPYFENLELLIHNLPHLLNRSAQLIDCQHKLAIRMADWYTQKAEYEDAMHCYAKALQIRPTEEVHRLASQLFIHFLRSRLNSLLPNSMPSTETLSNYLDHIASFARLGATKEDLRPFYELATKRLNSAYNQERYAACYEAILHYETTPFKPLAPITQRYWEAFQFYRKHFNQECSDVRAFQKKIFQAFQKFFNIFVEDAFFILGKPPCGYDIRAMGSTAREEICPYSDLEFMILVERQDPYFKALVEILHLQIAALGETARFEFVFTCIHRKNPSGLHIDNSPNQEERLIQTPAHMAALQKKSVTDPGDIAHTVLKTISLAKSTPDLFASYQEHLKVLLPKEERASTFLKVRHQDFKELWKTCSIFPNIKKQYVELLNLFLSDLALYHGILATNTLDIIDELPNFTSASRLLLKECVTALYKIRLRLHLAYREQKEEASIRFHPSYIPLRNSEILALQKCYWLVLCPFYSQTPYEDLLSCAQTQGYFESYRLKTFHHALKNLMAPFKTPVKITAPFFSGYLKPAFNILDVNGNIKPQYKNCAHNVCAAGGFHFKQKPAHPLMEYAIFSLTSRIAGKLTPASTLVRFDVKGKSYPVLISETIPGSYWENQKPEIKQLTRMLLAAILTRPGDGRISNYVLDNGMLYCVDNDICFVEPLTKEWGSRTVQFCSALFFMHPLSTPLDSEVLQAFKALDSSAILDSWIEDVIEKEKEYTALFSPEEQEKLYTEEPNNAFTPTILFRKGALATLDLQFWKLQNLISRMPQLTAGDLLKELISIREENIGAFVYKAYNQAKDLKQATSRTQESSLTSVQYHKACLGKIPTHDEIVKQQAYTPQKARGELFATLLARCSAHADIVSRPGKITIRANFENVEVNRQALILKALGAQAYEQKPHVVILHHCTSLTSALLAPFLHPGLECLDLSYCSGIDDGVFSALQTCISLKELNLTATSITQIKGWAWSPLVEFPRLEHLILNRCPRLEAIHVRALSLKTCHAKHNPPLGEVTIKAGCLAQIDCKDSPQVKLNHISLEVMNTLKGGPGIMNLSILADGTLASGYYDGIRLWNPKTGSCLLVIGGYTDLALARPTLAVLALAVLADGTLASGSYDGIRLWDPKTGSRLHTLKGHTDPVEALAVFADGTLISGSNDNTIKLWDPKTGSCLCTLKGHTSLVSALAELADGTLASGSFDRTIKLWDPKTGSCLRTLEGHTNSVKALAVLADGTLASGSLDNTIKLWDPKTGSCLRTLEGHTEWVYALATLADGTLASGSRDKTIKLWDPKTGSCLRTLKGHTKPVYALAVLPNGTLVSGSDDYTIKLWR